MKPATEKQKSQVLCLEKREEIELNSTQADPLVQSACFNADDHAQSDYAQNTTTFD